MLLMLAALLAPMSAVAQDGRRSLPFEVVEYPLGTAPGTRMVARNLGTVPVVLDSIHLTRCLNLPKATCASHAVGLELPVDSAAREFFRVIPLATTADYRYSASFSWHTTQMVAETTTVLITPEGTLSIRQQLASPFTLLGLSDRLGLVEDSLQRVGRGVWVYDVQVGNGATAEIGSRVDLHHVGMFADGRIFTQTGRKPFTFTLGEGKVIDGWEDGVLGMRVGGRRQLVIPSDLGYGAKGDGLVPPNAVLVFDVTLTGVGN